MKTSIAPLKVKDVTACVVDYGSFICLAEKLAESYKKVYYYTPTSQEFYSIADLVKAEGLPEVERVFDIFDPEFLDKVDLFVFPDIGYGGLQRHLRDMGKAVWGSMGADELEIMRTTFLQTLKKLKLPVIHSETVVGLSALREHIIDAENKWIKINKYRGNMETWHHLDYEHSIQQLDKLAIEFGGLQDTITFVVQDYIKTDAEIGYDGWCVDGEFPDQSFQGFEGKNETYLGALTAYKDLPEHVRLINEALSPILKQYGYRNFFATEIRIKDDTPYFIDPTMRMPGQTGEQLLETCSNIAEIIWYGAQGELIKPEFEYKFAASATLHHKAPADSWKTLRVPRSVRRWTKLFHHCELDGMYHFPPKGNDELGVMIAAADTIEDTIEELKNNIDELSDEPIHCELHGFIELLDCVEAAKEYGIEFTTDEIPDMREML